jgi:malate dehydrogenase (oxaloacetate-decarboxylating)
MKSAGIGEKAITLHKKLRGKIFVKGKISVLKNNTIRLIYTPGVAAVCEKIYHHSALKYELTSKWNNVAIVTDGTRILGLGNIGPDAALPVMEGKSVLYQEFGGVSAFPICLNTVNKDEIITTIKAIEPVFGAINLEDIESPKVLEISEELEKSLSIPVFHDDRHGTAVVVLAALLNSFRLLKKDMSSSKIIVAGAGSAGYGIARLLSSAGCKQIIVTDSGGSIYKGRKDNMNKYKNELSTITNHMMEQGSLEDVLVGSDVFIGVSGKSDIINSEMIKKMNHHPIVFSLTNPNPEIDPEVAKKAGATIVATGSYLYPNKVNNALVFPHLMRAILDKRIKTITTDILLVAAKAIANTVSSKELGHEHILPEMEDKRIQRNLSKALSRIS